MKYNGEETYVIIGDNNIIREYVTMHRGTPFGNGKTVLGDENFIMAYAHVAHDCTLGNRIVMASYAALGGHVEIGDNAIIGGIVAIHQFVRIGTYAFVGGATALTRDIPPYITASGMKVKFYGINVVNLQRNNVPAKVITGLRKAYKVLFRSSLTMEEAIKHVHEDPIYAIPEVKHMVDFIRGSKRGVTRR
jgi:UDP-N-acetylglucosamine acyltransferase